MIALMLEGAEEDLEAAFNYYEVRRSGLGGELVDEFRRAVSQILEFPGAWQALDETYRRCRLHRFPYGVVYGVDRPAGKVIIVAVAHLSRGPGWWWTRDRQ